MTRKTDMKMDYITKDYEGFRNLMISLIPQKTPEWTDLSESDLGIVLVELFAHGLDVVSYYQDKAFAEALLPTAQNRRSIINLCKGLGYTLKSQTPAKFNIKMVKNADYLEDKVVIPKGTKVSTDTQAGSPIIFELDNDIVIEPNVQEGYVTATQGESIVGELVGYGTGKPNLKLKLGMADVLEDTLEVYTTFKESGEENVAKTYWTKVPDFLSSSPEDKHFTVDVDEFNNTYIVFGNGLSGSQVGEDLIVNADYRYGGGAIGNVGLNTINTFPTTDIAEIFSITNPEPAIERGRDSESIQHAKDSAPRFYRMQDRCITRQDFIDVCILDRGVALVEVVESFNIKNEIFIYIVPDDYSNKVPDDLKNRLLSTINSKKLLKDIPVILDPTYLEFDINVKITAFNNFVNSQVKEAVETKLRKAFGIENMTYNEDILIGNIYSECLGTVGVKNVAINNPTSDVLVYDSTTNTPRVAKLRNLTVAVEGGVENA